MLFGFQARVIRSALALFDRPSGPVLEDFPEEAPPDALAAADDAGWACPVSFARPAADAPETHAAALHQFISDLPGKPIVVGHSYGGPVALRLAVFHQHRA